MVHSLFRQFRDRYPSGSLCANLLTIQDGVYVVRAVVTVETIALVSGMAAAANLEQAEDQAYHRALSALGLWDADNRQLEVAAAQSPDAPVVQSIQSTALSPAVSPDSTETAIQPMSQTVPVASPEHKQVPLAPTPLDSFPAELPNPELLDPAIKAAAIAQLPDMSGGPVDLSDIMAQTDVELRRLGWDVVQGRDYLEKTYGKRSRHELTDEELLSFLLYLETLSDSTESQLHR
ncbi:MAG: hypothetical protein AAFZ49_19640 [Cyanobacteria bacterium J06659_2]